MAMLSKARILSGGLSLAVLAATAWTIRERGRQQAAAALQEDEHSVVAAPKQKKEIKRKVEVNLDFVKRLHRVLKIAVPGVLTPEFGYAVLVAGLLVVRTTFDIKIINLMTSLERVIVARSAKGFRTNLIRFCLLMVPISAVNALLKYGQAELALRVRDRITRHLVDQYFRSRIYYKVANVDTRVRNADQLLTVDVERFATSLAALYCNLSKPLLDVSIYSVRLALAIGLRGPSIMIGYLMGSGLLLTWIRQPATHFTVAEQRAEGKFRFMHSRLIMHSEEIAFYDGHAHEQHLLDKAFSKLIGVLRHAQQFRLAVGVLDNTVAKYMATVLGYIVVATPFMQSNEALLNDASYEQRLEAYLRSGKMLVKLSEGLGRLVLSGRDVTRLAGFTSRVTELMDVFEDLDEGMYDRVRRKFAANRSSSSFFGASFGYKVRGSSCSSFTHDDDSDHPALSPLAEIPMQREVRPGLGVLQYADNVIEFDDVPLVAPNGEVLVQSLSVRVEAGMNVVVMGPNGCGKSSLFRILAELWPLCGGTLTKPPRERLFYIPQRPYLTLGTLRDQILYPQSQSDVENHQRTDDDLMALLEAVHLAYLVDRDGGWDTVDDWADVLSGGEKQRLAMARLFYHQPQFAILDECTSAVSVDVEGDMYRECRRLGITLFTVSHRRSLWQYHDYVLRFDGHGDYEFRQIQPGDEAQGS